MRRALRWLWRTFCKVALAGVLLLGVYASLWVAPSSAFAQSQPSNAQVSQTVPELHPEGPTPEQQQRAHERARRSRLIYLGSLLYQGVLLFGFLALGGTRWLARITARFGNKWLLGLLAVVGILTLGATVLTFPLDYYTGFVFQHQYGLSNQTTLAWLRDYLVGQGVGLVLGIPLLALLYLVLRRAPRTWWIWATAVSVPVSIFIMLITPVFITPLFNKFTPLQDEKLRAEILALAHQQGIPAQNVYEMDASRQSNAVNAYVIGFGPTLRIVLYDTLLQYFTPDEIKFILAHEMGHYKLGHIYQGIGFAILGTLAGSFLLYKVSHWLLRRFGGFFGFDNLGNPAGYPLLMALAFILSLIATPVGNAFSRHIEWQADRYAVQVYDHAGAGITAFHKLAQINVSEENPPRWVVYLLYSHPSIADRIAALKAAEAQEK
ncbi:MAG: M48 family metallopeptidase [Armatimonadota bacterium]